MFASSSSRLTTTSSPMPARDDDASASRGQQRPHDRPRAPPAGVAVDQVGHRLPGRLLRTTTLRCADGCGLAALGAEPRKAVDTVVDTNRDEHAGLRVEPHPAVAQRGVQTAHPGRRHMPCQPTLMRLRSRPLQTQMASPARLAIRPGHLGSHTSYSELPASACSPRC